MTIMPQATQENADKYLGPLNDTTGKYQISGLALAAFMATIAEESGQLKATREFMSYSAERLGEIFPTHFAESELATFARHPVMIANRVYAGRLGNGDEAMGDGWRYRGGGLMQLTGRDMYNKYSLHTGAPLIEQPELIERPDYSADSAGWVFAIEKNLNAEAAAGNFRFVTKKINGGFNGWSNRLAFYERAKAVLL